MTTDVFYQGQGIRDIEHIEVAPEYSFADLKALLIKKHGCQTGILIFLEDSEEPLDEALFLRDHVGPHGVKVHIHSCRQIKVSVTFNGDTVHHKFTPATTVARVKHWAAEKKFGMSPAEASEHVLQIVGTHDRPAPGTHLGALQHCKECRIAFDLVPDERVNG